jgi:cytochrome b subunit of formate dehydrogenase
MFRILSTLLLLVLFVLIALDMRKEALKHSTFKKWFRTQWESVRLLWLSRRSMRPANALGVLRGLVYLLTLALFLILALTGFIPVVFFGGHVSGVLLLIHATAAPLFALSLALLSLLWAHRQRFSEENWDATRDLVARKRVEPDRLRDVVRKVCFWLILFFSLPLILSIILGVFPLFGTEGQENLVLLHGISALLLTTTAVIHTYTLTTHGQRRPYYHGEHTQ